MALVRRCSGCGGGGGNGHIDERYVSMHAICVFVPVQWHWHWHLAIIASIGNKKDS